MNISKSIIGLLLFVPVFTMAQNVGVGTTNPSEKLDVNGNLNVQGQIKMAGVQGSAGQVLMKNGSNNPIWSSVSSDFDTLAVFDNNFQNVNNPITLNTSWTVPAGVTKIFVELWGAGGGGGVIYSGAAGGYVSGFISTNPGTSIPIVVGAGGTYASGSVDAETGGQTSIIYNGQSLIANGGEGSLKGITIGTSTYPFGGFYAATNVPTAFGLKGGSGNGSKSNFGVKSATVYFEETTSAKGGDAPLYPNSGPQGGYRIVLIPGGISVNYFGQRFGMAPGVGGSSDNSYGYPGGSGAVIIRWKK